MPGMEQFHSTVYQLDHLSASLDAACMMFNIRSAKIRTGKVNRLKKILHRLAKFDLKLVPYLLYRQFKTPNHIPVFLQKAPCIVVQWVISYTLRFLSRNINTSLVM